MFYLMKFVNSTLFIIDFVFELFVWETLKVKILL